MGERIQIIHKGKNKEVFELLTSFGLYNKFTNDTEEAIYVTQNHFAIGYAIQEIDKIKKKLNIE